MLKKYLALLVVGNGFSLHARAPRKDPKGPLRGTEGACMIPKARKIGSSLIQVKRNISKFKIKTI